MRFPVYGLAACLLVALAASFPARPAPAQVTGGALLRRWNFEQGTQGWTAGNVCTLQARDGALHVTVTGADPYFYSPALGLAGPVVVRFRARCATAGQGRLYWTVRLPSLVSSAWGDDAAIYYDLKHDGQWHEYSLPVDVEGTLTQIRLDPGKAPGQAEYDWIELARLPEDAGGSAGAPSVRMPATLRIQDGPLALTLDTRRHRYTLTDARTRRRWTSAPPQGPRLVEARRTGPATLRLSLRSRALGRDFRVEVRVSKDGILRFDMDTPQRDTPFDRLLYPPRLESDFARGALVFTNRSCGQIVDQRAEYPVRSFGVYANLGLDMPWFGVTDLARGDGMMLLVETPADAMVDLQPDGRGRQWPQVRWLASLQTWRYPRRVSYRFTPRGGYVGLAKAYRAYARAAGQLKTLRQKAKERPNVARLLGAPSVWGVTWGQGDRPATVLQFVLEARSAGMMRGIINGNGKFPAQDMARMNALGFLTGEYDNYDDIRDGPLAMTQDNVEKVALRGPDGQPAKGWLNEDGSQMYRRASSQALAAARRLLPPILKDYPFTARFLDVTSTVDLTEDYHPARRTDRRQDMRHRQALYRYIASLGLVVGGEHGKAWNSHLLDYAEGMMSGPFWWEMPAGYLKVPASRTDIKPNFLRYGIEPAVRIPLWELVFHDCVVTTWYWGDSSGYYFDVAPELSDRKDLLNMLYGTVPLMWVNHIGYGWNRHRARFLETYRNTCKLHEAVGFEEMTDHAFLSADRAVQRTRFGSGAVVVVNFGDTPRAYRDGRRTVTLAPRGFYARAPGLRQSRLVERGQVVTRLEAKGLRSLETKALRQDGPFTVAGRLTAFETGRGRWRLVVESAGECRVDTRKLPGSRPAASSRLFELRADGTVLRDLGPASGVVRIPGGPGLRLYEVRPEAGQAGGSL